ncbi:MAG: DUF899 domain-containing protein [Candidatus Dormibacteria bacterium]
MNTARVDAMESHPVVSSEEWMAERIALLKREKEFTRLRDELTAARRALPWTEIQDSYVFEGPEGEVSLGQLFEGHSQLIVYHFMFDPTWDEGCPNCSFWADHFDGVSIHLPHRDVTLVAISRAPYAKLRAFRERMGWGFRWVSSHGSDFNYDFHASFTPEQIQTGEALFNYRGGDPGGEDREGASVFYRNSRGAIFHTYSCHARGIDLLNGTYNFLDLTPRGRDEDGPEGPLAWVRYHDRYGDS